MDTDPTVASPLEEQLAREREKFRSIQQIARAVGSTLDLDDLLHLIVGKITELMDADRSTLYVMDALGSELWTKVLQADELREIRLKVGQGIAGYVAKTGELCNIRDAYDDPRFSPETDRRSGYRTRSILCGPMKDNTGRIIGVVQVLNKRGDMPFSTEDEELFEALVSQASIAVENSQLYRSVLDNNEELERTKRMLERRVQELDLLLDIEQQVQGATTVDEMLDALLSRTMTLIGAEAASILLLDEGSDQLAFRSVYGKHRAALKNRTVQMGSGISGWVAQHGTPALVDAPQADPRHNSELAREIGFKPRSVLCVPLGQRSARGALELLNKTGRSSFDEDDLRVVTLIAGRATQAIELARAKEQRIKENRLAAIGQMLSGVLHDLKTPMTVISGYAQLMAQDDDQQSRQEYSDQILRQFDVVSAMMREVLAFARGESRVLIRKVYMHRFLKEVQEALRHEFAGRHIELEVEQNYRGVAYMDEIKFRRVFHNIGRNAAQAMESNGGGRFVITVDADPDSDKLLFRFSDTGTGIPQELEGRLFELFASHGKREGTGLGLAIVKKIVDDHDGEISYVSDPHSGTTFTISLPLSRPGVQTGEVRLPPQTAL
ncbi:MAG: GAF domain-containing protein [Myxococcales bacterium]|nr:GAF domain-containing protein [Myxococcales bacterium]